MRVLVCGGRKFGDRALFNAVMAPYRLRASVIIHGAARGADRMADNWAQTWGIHVERYPAKWHQYGKAAGPLRNQQMLDEGRPDLVIAFPGGNGTADMVTRARAA